VGQKSCVQLTIKKGMAKVANQKSLEEFSRILRKRMEAIQCTYRDLEENQKSYEMEDLIALAQAVGRMEEINNLLDVIADLLWKLARRRIKITIH
jgi:hypothetical protein